MPSISKVLAIVGLVISSSAYPANDDKSFFQSFSRTLKHYVAGPTAACARG